VPVWGEQLDVTRDAAADGLGKLLETFANMSGTLGTLASQLDGGRPTLDAGAIEGVLSEGSPGHAAIASLMAPSRRAFAQRDAAVAELSRCADAVIELRQLGRQAREVGKHTRLVAFNASIEANRGSGGSDSGSQAVANEIGEQVERLVAQLDKTLSPARLHAEISDTPPEELQLELELRARESLNALMAGLGGAMHGSVEARAAASALQSQIEDTFVMFQFGDRISQMLQIVSTDMQNFGRWVHANPYATQSDAADWLANLEQSYTMDEQRSQHHGNVHIDRGSEVEFF
jgi:methyl-accepting chemotaxis protein